MTTNENMNKGDKSFQSTFQYILSYLCFIYLRGEKRNTRYNTKHALALSDRFISFREGRFLLKI